MYLAYMWVEVKLVLLKKHDVSLSGSTWREKCCLIANVSTEWKTNVKVLKGSVKPDISEGKMAPAVALKCSHSSPGYWGQGFHQHGATLLYKTAISSSQNNSACEFTWGHRPVVECLWSKKLPEQTLQGWWRLRRRGTGNWKQYCSIWGD